jgi:hypothetical protein
MPETPEHHKLNRVRDQSQACGEFLEWLSGKRLVLCFYDDESAQYQPAHVGITRLLAEFFGIDQDRLSAEKDALLAYQRALNDHYKEAERAAGRQ